MGKWLNRLFNEQKLIRRLMVVWAIWLITLVVLRTTADTALISPAVADTIKWIVGILTVPLAFYFKHRKEDESK